MQPILPTTPTSLPVKQINQLPDFDISPLSIVPGLEMLLAEGRALLESMEKITTPSWGTVVEPIDSLMHRMEAYWSPIGHLNAVMKTAAFQEEHDKAEQLSTAFATEFMQNETLYQLFTALTLTAEYGAYSSAMKKALKIICATSNFQESAYPN